MRNLLQDVRFGLRVLSGSPSFSAVAALTLGLGIACTTTVFSWIDSVMLHPFHGAGQSDQLAAFEMITTGAPNGGTAVSYPDFRDYRDNLKGLAGLALHRQCAFTLGDTLNSRLTWGELVSGNYFAVMGIKPVVGRMFSADEARDVLSSSPVVVISAQLWRSYFNSDPYIAGKTLKVNRHAMTIVGVAPSGFRGASAVMRYDLWVPATMGPALGLVPESALRDRDDRGAFNAICRRRNGVSVEQARAEAFAFSAGLAAANPKTNAGIRASVVPTWEEHNGVNEYLRTPLTILMAVSCVVLLIVCANVANLLVARSVARQREFGIRCALGAGRVRVAIQVLTETLVLATIGSGLGLLILLWLQGSLIAMVPSIGFPVSTSLAFNGRILAFTALACVSATLISGASPALFVFHTNLNEVLKEGSRGDTSGFTSRRMRNLLVIGEVALATIALVGAGLFVRSFRNLRAVNPGFDSSNVLLGRFFIETAGFSGDQIQQFSARLKDNLLAAPGVRDVSYTTFVPLSTTAGPYNFVRVEGYTPARGESTAVNRALISPGYFATLGIPLMEGRDFSERDNKEAEPAIVVNQAFAARFFQGQNPVGRKVRAEGRWRTVIGMARDSKYFSPSEVTRPFFYLPFRQSYQGSPELLVLIRTAAQPEQSIPVLRRVVTQTDPAAAAFHAVPLAEYTQVATFGQKVAANLMGALGVLCLVLAATGMYSMMAYTVSQRIPEIGIRMAMGARPMNVVTMIVRQGMRLLLTGLLLGVVGAFAAARLVTGMLFRVDASDPITFVGTALFLAAVSLVAIWWPAFRATRIDPVTALRQ